jgi:hypothetical protein
LGGRRLTSCGLALRAQRRATPRVAARDPH